jgi:hypothetical protein
VDRKNEMIAMIPRSGEVLISREDSSFNASDAETVKNRPYLSTTGQVTDKRPTIDCATGSEEDRFTVEKEESQQRGEVSI